MIVSHPTWTGALGWALLHFLWQGAVVAVLLWCALALLAGCSSRLRYAVCCAALVLVALLPAATFVQLGGLHGFHGTELAASWTVDVNADSATAPESWPARAVEALNAAAPVLPWIWLAGVAVSATRLGFGLAVADRMRRGFGVTPETAIELLFRSVAVRLGVHRVVCLLESARVEVPTVVGWLRPAVLLPLGCFAGLSGVQVEALLAHELAHIRRHDYLVSVLQSVLEALLFYHPAVWWISRQVRRERECCCDEIAATLAGDPLEYARALSRLEEQRVSASAAVVLGANGGALTMRIKRILAYRQPAAASQIAAAVILGAFVLSAGVLAVRSARAQSALQANSQSISAAPAQATVPSTAEAGQQSSSNSARESGHGQLPAPAVVSPGSSFQGRIVREIDYNGLSSISPGELRAVLRQDDIHLAIERPLSPPDLFRTGVVLKQLLAERGRASRVRIVATAISPDAVAVRFNVQEFPAAANAPAPRRPALVSAGIMAGNAILQPPPVYPLDAKTKHVQGAVTLKAIVSKSGDIENLAVVSGPKELQQSALDAVKQWKYKPYLLNGQPVAVETTIRVNYTLGSGSAPGASALRAVRVTAAIMAGQAVRQTAPVYPPDAKAKSIQGTVVLRARVSKEGNVEDLQVESGPDELRRSAIDAVRQWKYKPYLLNGQSVAVDTTINVHYSLAR